MNKFIVGHIQEIILAIGGIIAFISAYIMGRGDGKARASRDAHAATVAVLKRRNDEEKKNVRVEREARSITNEILNDPNSGFHN